MARLRSSNTKTAAPSPMTNPSRDASNGRDDRAGSSFRVLIARMMLKAENVIGETGARHRELREAIQPPDAFGIEMVLRPKIGDLGGHAAAIRLRIEACDRPDGGSTCLQSGPETIGCSANGGYGAYSCNDDPTETGHCVPFIGNRSPHIA